MKFFLLILPGLLLFECLQGSTLPQGRPTRALNTTLRTNFSGIYQRRNPCCGTEVETSSYKASHELHHHTKDDCWSDYTHKCSAIIRNFLQTIGNLIKFNHDPNGSFNFYLNTSISQKQRLTGDPKSCESLPTIVIEATDCKIPIDSCCEISRGSNGQYKSADDRKQGTDQCQDEETLSLPDFSAQESQQAVSRPHAEATMPSVPSQSTTYPGKDWFEAEENSSEDDKYKFPTADEFSPEALYQLSRDTKSPYEPKPKIFKTSLKLTPQADPENGTIKPRIQYMAAKLVPDPGHSEPPIQSETERPFIQPGSSGPLMPVPFPEAPNHSPLESPPQVSPPPAASPFQSYPNPNEPVQLPVNGQPEPRFPLSQTEKLPEATAPFRGEPFTAPVDLSPLPARLSNDPSQARTPVGRINDPQFSFEPLQSQPATTVNRNPDIPAPLAPQFVDVSSRPTPPNSRSDLTVSPEGQAQPNLLQLPRQRPQEDLPSQVSQPAVDFPGQPPKVNGEALNNPTALIRPPTVGDDLSIESKPQTFTPNFGNPVPRDDHFNAQQISPPYQQFPGQLPYNNRLPSPVPPSTDGDISSTTPLPPFQSRVPNYSSLVPGENKEENNVRPSQSSVNSYSASIPANGLPYSDSSITSTPGLGGRVEPSDSYLGQQPTSDGQSPKRIHSSTVTTVEETVTLNEEPTTPKFVLDATAEQLPGRLSDNLNPSSPSGPDLSSYKASQQFPPVLPKYPQPQLPRPGLFPNNDMENDSQPIGNPDQLTPEGSRNADYSQITDPTLNPNNDQVQRLPETSQTVPVPFQQESQLPEPDLPMTTPIPFAPNPPIAPEGKPSSAIYPNAGPTTSPTQSYPSGEYNLQIPGQQSYSTPEPVPASEPLASYFDQNGTRAPPASDSFVRSDFLTAAAPQPLTGNVNGIPSIPDNSMTYGAASVDRFTESPQQKRPLLNPENNPAGPYGRVRSGSPITEGALFYLPSNVTPAPLQEQQPLDSASSERFQDQISQLPTVTENPEVVPSQEQFVNDQNQRRNPPDVYSATMEKNFQTPFRSTTPVYGIQSSIEGDSKRIFEPQTENKSVERIPIITLGSLELSEGKQTTDSAMSLQPISPESFPENRGPSEPNIFPGVIDGTPAAERPNREFALNRPSAFVSSLPADEPSSGVTPGYPDSQQPSQNSEQFSNFNPQPSPGLPAGPLAGLPLPPASKSPYQNDNFDQVLPVSPKMTAPSINNPSSDSLPAFPLSQDAATTPSTDSPVEYTQPPTFQTGENRSPQPTLYSPTQTTPPQLPPSSAVSQSQDLVLETPQETSESSVGQPVLFETNTVQPPASLQVGPAVEIIPPPAQTGVTGPEGEITPQVFDGASPQFAFNPQSGDGAVNQQETPVFDRREEPRPNDFGQNINTSPVASLPQRSSFQTTTIEETTTTTSVPNSNQFSTDSTEAPFAEPLQTLAGTTPAGEIAQQQSFPSSDSQQLPNYADRSSSSFAPLVSQQANADRSSVPFPQQAQSLDLSATNAAPEMTPTQQEPQRQVDPVYFSSNPPSSPSAESQTLSQDNLNFQQRDHRLPETAPLVNLQGRPYGPYNAPLVNSYNGNIPTPPRGPIPDGYPAPNYMRPPLSDPENRPPFYGQQPPPSPPLNSFSQSESTESETVSQSSGPQTQPGSGVPFNPEGQLPSANIPPANPNGPMPPFAPNYNPHRPQDRYRYFGPPNYDPRLRLPNQQNLPPYPNSFPLRDPRPVPPPMNQIINNPRESYPLIRPNFQPQPGREMNEGQAFRQQTEDRLPVDPRIETQLPTSPAQRPPPALENDLPNPILQALQSHLVVPTREQPPQRPSFPGRPDQNEPLPFDTKNASQINNAPASLPNPGQWNPPPATNFVNLQQNPAFGVPNGPQPRPRAPLPDQTAPSNKPDPVSTGRSDIVASPLRNSFYADRMRGSDSPVRTEDVKSGPGRRSRWLTRPIPAETPHERPENEPSELRTTGLTDTQA